MSGIYALPSKTILLVGLSSGIPVWQKNNYPKEIDVLIRWGITAKGPHAQKTYNTAHAIRLASDKYACRKLLRDNGVPVPLLGGVDKYPLVGRPFKHQGGRKFWFCRTGEDCVRAKEEGAQYFSQYYPKTTEYRVHIGSNRVIAYQKKIPPQVSRYNWNHSSGSFFVTKGEGKRRGDIIRIAKEAMQVIGLDFGAVDVLADPGFPGFPPCVVCEINTTPALEGDILIAYSTYFLDKIRS